jgi:hypothetical protein
MRVAVAVEQVPEQAAFRIARVQKPVCDGKREVHVDVHHDPYVVMRRMVPPDRIDERRIADEPVVVHISIRSPGQVATCSRIYGVAPADHRKERTDSLSRYASKRYTDPMAQPDRVA